MICFLRIRLLPPFVTCAVALLQLFFVHSQNDGFVHFVPFEFPVENSANFSDSQLFTFAISSDKSAPLNVSVNTGEGSAIVLSAQLCDFSLQSASSDRWSPRTDGILALTANSDQFKSVILRPNDVPVADQCPPSNHTADQSVLLLKVHSMVNGSRGTVAVRRTDTAPAAIAFTDDGMPNELVEQNEEWLLMQGQQPLILPIDGICAVDCPNLVRYAVHMAVRQGSAEVALVQNCSSSMNDSMFENRTVVLDNFPSGEYLRLLDINFGQNDTINVTVLHRNHSRQQTEIVRCANIAGLNESSLPGGIRLFISVSSAQPVVLAISQLRIFNAAHLSPPEGMCSTSIAYIVGFVCCVLLLIVFGLFGVFVTRRFFLRQRRVHYQNEQQKNDGHQFELLDPMARPPSTVSKMEMPSPGPKLNKTNSKALLEERAMGNNGSGWM